MPFSFILVLLFYHLITILILLLLSHVLLLNIMCCMYVKELRWMERGAGVTAQCYETLH